MAWKSRKMRTKHTKKVKRSRRRLSTKKVASIGSGTSYKFGLTSQGIASDLITPGDLLLINESPYIPSVYTGGPLQLSTGGTMASATPSMFNVAGVGDSYDFGLACQFTAADLFRFSAIAANYDFYRIRKVEVKIEYLANMETSSGNPLPTITWCVDRDDANVPTGKAGVTGHNNHKFFQFSRGKTCTIKFRPYVRNVIMSDSGVGWQPKSSLWLDTTNNKFVPHFGLKMWVTDVSLPATKLFPGSQFRFTYNYWVDFKTPINLY